MGVDVVIPPASVGRVSVLKVKVKWLEFNALRPDRRLFGRRGMGESDSHLIPEARADLLPVQDRKESLMAAKTRDRKRVTLENDLLATLSIGRGRSRGRVADAGR